MKPKDITVGQKYTHIKYKGVVYLGVGRSTMRNTFVDKQLIICEDKEIGVNHSRLGNIVIPPTRKMCKEYGLTMESTQDFWSGFEPFNP